jgi:proteasome accessory factor B
MASRAARLRYRAAGRSTAEETVDVLALAFEPPRWLVAAWSRERGALRVLDLGRILRVRASRRRAGRPPDGFDPLAFSLRAFLDPGAGPARPASFRLANGLAALAPALVPTALCRPDGEACLCQVRATRPDVVAALAGSIAGTAAIDSRSHMAARAQGKPSTESRLLGLASWILAQPDPVTREQIYEAFPDDYAGKADAREKKFTRDKDALRRLGFDVETEQLGRDDGVGYFIDARSCALPDIELTPEEAALVWAAGAGALRFSRHPLRDDLESALRKLVVGARGLPPRAARTDDLAPEPPPGQGKLLERLIDAWERRRTVTIGYWRLSSGEVLERRVDVYGWASRRGEWLFVGHCHLREANRVFYLSRVRSLVVSKGDPARQDYQVPDDFDVRRWSRQEIWDYHVHAPRPAVVRFRGSLAGIARQLLPAAKVAIDADGARVARLEVQNLRGLVRQALAWGPEAELVEPEDGRAMAREILARLGGEGRPP